jgi:hypothetical protein
MESSRLGARLQSQLACGNRIRTGAHASNRVVYNSEWRPHAVRVKVEHIKPGTEDPWRQIVIAVIVSIE